MRRITKHVWIPSEMLQPIVVQSDDGTTTRAIEIARAHAAELGAVKHIELVMPYGDSYPDSLVRLIDGEGKYIQLDGLSWGYAGTGPHGLAQVFKMFSVPIGIDCIVRWDQEHFMIDVVNAIGSRQAACTSRCTPTTPEKG